MKTKTFLMLFISLFAFSCSDDNNNEPNNSFPQEITPVLLATYGFDNIEGITEHRTNLVITTQEEWTDLINRIEEHTWYLSGLDVNFNEEMVIASFEYEYVPLGAPLEIDLIMEYKENIIVNVKYTELDLCHGITADISNGYYIVKIPKTEKPVSFTSTIYIPDCPED